MVNPIPTRRALHLVLAIAMLIPLTSTARAASAGPPSRQALANLSYQGVFDHPVQLVNGSYQGEPFMPGGASRPRLALLQDLTATTDLNDDRRIDAVVLLAESAGGSATFIHLAAVLTEQEGLTNVATTRISDAVRVIALDANNGKIALDYLATAPDEPRCCPSQRMMEIFDLHDPDYVNFAIWSHGSATSRPLPKVAGCPTG